MADSETYYFDNANTINAIFGGNALRNLKKVEKALGVELISRDSWVKTTTNNDKLLRKTLDLISELTHIYDSTSQVITQLDYIRGIHKKIIVFGIGIAGTGKTYHVSGYFTMLSMTCWSLKRLQC
jgi:phosphate starvation-inducible protein PhoH